MTDKCETCRDCRTTIPLSLQKVSNLYAIICGRYASPNVKNQMCELCTFSQIQSQLMLTVPIIYYACPLLCIKHKIILCLWTGYCILSVVDLEGELQPSSLQPQGTEKAQCTDIKCTKTHYLILVLSVIFTGVALITSPDLSLYAFYYPF